MGERAVLLRVGACLTDQLDLERVAEVVDPLRVETVSVQISREDHFGIVEIALSDEECLPPQLGRTTVDRVGQLGEEWLSLGIEDLVDGIKAEAVDTALLQPHQRAVVEEGAHLVAVLAVEIEGI